MISDIASFIRYFEGVHRRTVSGWPVQQIFGQRYEDVAAQREEEERRVRGG